MKKLFRSALIAAVVFLIAAAPVLAAELTPVTDQAGLLTESEIVELSAMSQQIAEKYGCEVYIITVQDYTEYTGGTMEDCAQEMYDHFELGLGDSHDGVLLLLSMEERDYWLLIHGDNALFAFSDYAQELVCDEFLDNFRYDDWYGGFRDYMSACEYMLREAEDDTPIDIYYDDPEPQPMPVGLKAGITAIIPSLISLIVCSVKKGQMRSVDKKVTAEEYVDNSNVTLTVCTEMFTHSTRHVEVIESSSGGSRSGGRGGTTINSHGSSGRGGKF